MVPINRPSELFLFFFMARVLVLEEDLFDPIFFSVQAQKTCRILISKGKSHGMTVFYKLNPSIIMA